MMSSLGSDKSRGPREKALPAATHTSQPQKLIQATAEQIRLAQMIYDKSDADFEDKVNQLMEVTGKNQDECMVALHDCNEDVSRAINFLLESTSDMTSWETVGKKKPLVKEGPSESKENKENREKKGEREASKGRAAANRKGKGASRSRQARPEENGVEVTPVDRGSDRGRRGKGGRGSGVRGRGRAPTGSRFSAQGMGTFNPADYTSEAGTGTTQTEVWDTVNNSTDGTGELSIAWRNTLEDWAAEDWSEDLSETKVFTSSCAPAAENHITPGQSLDLTSLLQKPVVGGREPPSSSSTQSLVFTNSHHHQQPPPSRNATSNMQKQRSLILLSPPLCQSSVLGAGFGDLGQAKRTQPSAGAQILEQLKGPGLGPLPSSQAAPPVSTQGSNTSIGRLPGLGFGLQPEPSLVLSQLVQRHTGPSLPLARQPSPPLQQQAPPASASPAPHHTSTPAQAGPVMAAAGAKPPAPSAGLDPQGSSTPQQQRAQLKGQKRRIPPTSKIPSTAVEMPGSADVPGLNLQFGALDFGSESALPEFGVVDNCVSTASRESTDSLGSSLSVALPLPLSSSEPVYHSSAVALPSLTPSSLGTASSTNPPSSSSATSTTSSVPSSSPFSTVGGTYDGTMPPHTRLAFSQNKEATGPVMSVCQSSLTGKAPPNLSQGVPPLLPNQYIMGPGGLLPAYPQIYGYEDLHMLQSRLPMDYYGITFPGPTATLSGRDGSLANNPYSGEVTKFGRNDSTSPAPPTSLAAPQPPQAQSQGQNQQAFLPPGYSYTGLPYYPGVPGAVPSAAAFQYGPTMFVPPGGPGPASAKQHSMGLSLGNPSASPFQQQTQQQPSGYGQLIFYFAGYEELTAGPVGVEYSKGYNSSSQAQAKSATGPGKGVSVTSSNSGVPDISGSVYNKTQSFDKQGFHAGTPPPFSLPSALGGPGPLNPGAAPGGYAPAPFLHILPHQQPHSQLLHHHLAQDGQGGPSQRGQSSSLQQKSQVNKSSYGSSPYWAN
uniref:UBA domain-containing protein n=1 Tax=Amphiprion ocellaris TaxID=80972 RepID=A0AAQ5YJX7_AMPOC